MPSFTHTSMQIIFSASTICGHLISGKKCIFRVSEISRPWKAFATPSNMFLPSLSPVARCLASNLTLFLMLLISMVCTFNHCQSCTAGCRCSVTGSGGWVTSRIAAKYRLRHTRCCEAHLFWFLASFDLLRIRRIWILRPRCRLSIAWSRKGPSLLISVMILTMIEPTRNCRKRWDFPMTG